ncbi:DUF423-domain-containing protein [Tilletiaria anomala UBC 951]|uniref:DUF423-domain-containing protein n=1 Tax=Tilletiaria anomala (strain ATCC 24038 / CBS 436.72 / UBC 951) TaxID=1037660 RepID=A0A066WHG8_TILAU|nr:DUF423-domain-containing protein [Tilletiaria anomala UBC 951]KDN51958.1 DUF423-domain-containing protein [Tilletiaria anomala UBC 951]
MLSQHLHAIACVSGATSVIAGAFGAHALRGRLTPYQLASWDKAVLYQLVHSVALLSLASSPSCLSGTSPHHRFAGNAWIAGIALFSGSIYGLCLTKEGNAIRKVLGPATPLGGLSLIVGWAALALAKKPTGRLF